MSGDAGEMPTRSPRQAGIVRFEQNRRGARTERLAIVIVVLSMAALALAAGASLIAVAPGALLLVASTSALAPKGPVAIEVGPDGIALVEEDGTTEVVPRQRIGSITVARWTSRLVIADRTGQVIVSRFATFYPWMPVREALLAAGYPWRDPVLTYGS